MGCLYDISNDLYGLVINRPQVSTHRHVSGSFVAGVTVTNVLDYSKRYVMLSRQLSNVSHGQNRQPAVCPVMYATRALSVRRQLTIVGHVGVYMYVHVCLKAGGGCS